LGFDQPQRTNTIDFNRLEYAVAEKPLAISGASRLQAGRTEIGGMRFGKVRNPRVKPEGMLFRIILKKCRLTLPGIRRDFRMERRRG
jgi:hypothetical protein